MNQEELKRLSEILNRYLFSIKFSEKIDSFHLIENAQLLYKAVKNKQIPYILYILTINKMIKCVDYS